MIKNVLLKIKFKLKKYIYINKYKKYKKYCKKKEQREFLIFNTPIHGNLGDHAIIYAEYRLLDKLNIKAFEIPTYEEKYIFDYIKNNISIDATISITGGGFIGSQWLLEENLVNKVVKNFANYKIIIFPATFYFKEDNEGKKELEKSQKIFSKAKDLTIFAREEKTYQLLNDKYKSVNKYLIPDIVLSLQNQYTGYRNGILVCLRSDVEGKFNKEDKDKILNEVSKCGKVKVTDTVLKCNVPINRREKILNKKIKDFSNAEIVITDRLHGMIFATITNTPCIVFGNYNYKVEGVYKVIKKIDKNIIFETDINNIHNDIDYLWKNKKEKNERNYNFDELKNVIVRG